MVLRRKISVDRNGFYPVGSARGRRRASTLLLSSGTVYPHGNTAADFCPPAGLLDRSYFPRHPGLSLPLFPVTNPWRVLLVPKGWYDGSEWFKPPDIRARDEMLNNYEVQPAVDRLKT